MVQETEIFVSYSLRDKELIDPYMRRLRKEFRLLLYDSIEKPSGEITDEIINMQSSAAGTIVFWTKSATHDSRVFNELEFGYKHSRNTNRSKFIIVIAEQGLKLPPGIMGTSTFYMDSGPIQTIIDGIREVVNKHANWSSSSSPSSTAENNIKGQTFGSSSSKSQAAPKQPKVEINRIADVQTILSEMGLYKGKPDGKLGPQTITALKEFQIKYHLPQGKIKESDIDQDFLNAVEEFARLAQYSVNLQEDQPGFWIFRLDHHLEVDRLEKGVSYYFKFNKKAPAEEYDLFKKIKQGDSILGYFDTNKSFVGVFKTIKGIPIDVKDGGMIQFELTEKLDRIVDKDVFKTELDEIHFNSLPQSDQSLHEINKELYERIIAAGTKRLYENLYRPFFQTEGDHKDTQDQLQFENDINSFASVIALKKVKPPLAIGLFGKWGSGKSFFMEKLYQKIGDIAKTAKEKEDPDNVQNVVQVKFNSWHYSDANLWASLITEIFDKLHNFSQKADAGSEIKKISDTLQITTMQKVAMESKRNELENTVRQLEQERNEKRARLEDLSGIKLLKLIFSDEKVQNDIKQPGIDGSIENLTKNKAKLDEYSKELDKTSTSVKAIWNFMKNIRGWRWIVVILSMVLIAGIVIVLPQYFPTQWQGFKDWLTATIATVTAVIALIGNFIYPVKKNIGLAKERLESMKKTLEQRPQADPPELESKVAELKQVTAALQDLQTRIDEAQKEIEDVRSGRKLLEFIEQRTRDENYSRQLGLISSIRKDFERLDDLLRKQHEATEEEKQEIANPQNVKLQIDRIILYIDDLDRCKEETVVKVLEAIHLLLAFPLFVVIVGVDPRWLNNALSEKYKTLFGSSKSALKKNQDSADAELFLSGAATSYDYLEKIFQIPFTLKPIDKPGRENLIAYLLKNEMKRDDPVVQLKDVGKEFTAIPARHLNKDDLAQAIAPDNQDKEPRTQPAITGNEKKVLEIKKEVALTFTDKEKEFMQEISPIFGHTPRGINRYVNIYRIIKAHKSLKVEDEFSEDEFIPVMVVLSVVVGYSVFAQHFVDKIFNAKEDLKFENLIEPGNVPGEVRSVLLKHLDKEILALPVAAFKRNLELISRFSFRTLINEL